MKLRYLSLKNYGPLKDVDVVFSASSPLNRNCSIRFVVGVNGSGKTHLLKALSEIFIALADWQPPHFPVTLIYELGGGRTKPLAKFNESRVETFILHSPGRKNQASFWYSHKFYTFPDDADIFAFKNVVADLNSEENIKNRFRPAIRPGEWTGKASTPSLGYLPKAVLAYTTGAPESWVKLWFPKADSEGADTLSHDLEYKWEDNERPLGWNIWQERSLNFASGSFMQETPADREKGAWQPLLLDKQKLKCALLSVTLPHTIENLERITQNNLIKTYLEELSSQEESVPGLGGLLARGGWAWPVAISVRQDSKNDGSIARHDRQNFQLKLDWLSKATQVIPEPYPGTQRTLWFDTGGNTRPVKSVEQDTQEDAYLSGTANLLNLLGGAGASSFERFEQLLDLLDRRVISDLNIMLRKIDHDDILSFEDLSDGEQMVLCRMALFHLLNNQRDVLLLLDEPETHFNDKWKREIVDIIDTALGHTANEVVISTHAALVLTDALKDEIILMKPLSAMRGSKVFPLGDDVHTFGATSDHPLRDVFGARDTVGRRASKLLEVLLAATAHASEVEAIWADKLTVEERTKVVKAVLATASATEDGLDETTVSNCLKVAAQFAEHAEAQKPFSMLSVLESFIEQTGPGYFKIELMRAWRKLKEGAVNAA